MIRGAIFDVDGTLLDSMGIWEDLGARYLKSVGAEAQQGLSEILYPMTVEAAAAYMKEQYALAAEVPQIVRDVLGIVRDFYFYEAQLKDGAKELLARLYAAHIPMAAATSSDRAQIERAFARLGIDRYFGRIFTCTEVGEGKSSPLIYEAAAKYLVAAVYDGTPNPADILVFEDVPHALATAKRAGFRTVGVYDRYSADFQEELRAVSDIYVNSLTEFTLP